MPIELLVQGKEADIFVYKNPRGEPLAFTFIQSLTDADKAKVIRLLKEFAERGEIKNTEKFRLEEKPIFAFKSYQTRLLCFYLPNTTKRSVVLTHGFTKKQNRLPFSELKKAIAIYNEIVR